MHPCLDYDIFEYIVVYTMYLVYCETHMRDGHSFYILNSIHSLEWWYRFAFVLVKSGLNHIAIRQINLGRCWIRLE